MRKLLAFFVALALLAPALPAAASPALRVTVRPGFDGVVRPGQWAPVNVALANSGPRVSGDLEITVLGRQVSLSGTNSGQSIAYTVPVTLPEHSSKQFSTAVYIPPLFDRLQVSLIGNGKTLLQQDVPLHQTDPTQLYCGVLSTDPSAFASLSGISLANGQRQPHLVQLDLTDLPTNPQLLSGLDCVIVSDEATRGLSAAQRSALTSWVEAGGILTIGTGATGASTVAGLPTNLLPAKLDGTAPIHSLGSLADYLGAPSDSTGPWLAANLKATDGTVVVADESQPLLIVARRGKGAVFMLALSLTQQPLRGWAGFDHLWRYILSYAPAPDSAYTSYLGDEGGWGRAPREVLMQGGSAGGPASQQLLFGLILFGLLVGPVNFLVLSRLGRRDLALLTVPALAALATAGAMVYARGHRQGDVVVNQVSIVRTWDGSGIGPVHSFVGVFGLHPQRYQLSVPPNVLVASTSLSYLVRSDRGRGAPALQVVASGQPRVRGIDLQPGRLNSFSLDGHVSEPGQIGGAVVLDGNHLGGTVVNGFPSTIHDAALVAGGSVESLGDLKPGAAHRVSLDLTSSAPSGNRDLSNLVKRLAPDQGRSATAPSDPRSAILDAALNPWRGYGGDIDPGPLSLIGWLDQPIETVKDPVDGEPAHQYTLFTTSLPLRLTDQSETIPAQLIDRQQLSASFSARLDQSGVTVNPGDTIAFQFTNPVDSPHFVLRSLTLVSVATSPVFGTLQAFDWRTGAWDTVPFATGAVTIPTPERFLSATGTVRLRFQDTSPVSPNTPATQFSRFQLLINGAGR